MKYFANPTSSSKVHEAMTHNVLGFIDTPMQGNRRPDGVVWSADNGCFGKGYPGDDAWFAWLVSNSYAAESCVFAVAPDVVGDAKATLARSAPWLPRIRELGYTAAFVAQDGLEHLPVPWDEFDVLFIGGSTEWKLGAAVRRIVREAKRRGKHIHMGRVNSLKRLRYAESIGCDSVDGTYLTFGPDINLPKLLSWVRAVEDQLGLLGDLLSM